MRSLVSLVYVLGLGICFGKIASKFGKNSFLYGFLFFIPIANLIVMAILAFRDEAPSVPKSRPGDS